MQTSPYRTIGTQNLQERMASMLMELEGMAGELTRRGVTVCHDFGSMAIEIEDAERPSEQPAARRTASQDYARFPDAA